MFLTWDPMGEKFQNVTPSTIMILFQPIFFLNIPYGSPHTKDAYRHFENSNLIFTSA